MTIEARLQELLDQKDRQIEELEGKLDEAERKSWRWTKHLENDHDPSPFLPIPRLELRWVKNEDECSGPVAIRYDLVYRHHLGHVERVPFGLTITTDQKRAKKPEDFKLMLPHRDSFHIRSDSKQLQLPAYAVDGEVVKLLVFDGDGERDL